MLYCAYQQAVSAIREAAYDNIGGFSRARCKHNSIRISIDRFRNLRSRMLNCRCCVLPERMFYRVRISGPSQPWQHDLQDSVIKWGCGLVVQKNVSRSLQGLLRIESIYSKR